MGSDEAHPPHTLRLPPIRPHSAKAEERQKTGLMDYDLTTIAATYDAARGYSPEVLRLWLDRVAAHAPPAPQIILDIGCGTGRFTHPLAERFDARVIGVDPSSKMLQAARSKPSSERVEIRLGSAEQLPMQDGSADL